MATAVVRIRNAKAGPVLFLHMPSAFPATPAKIRHGRFPDLMGKLRFIEWLIRARPERRNRTTDLADLPNTKSYVRPALVAAPFCQRIAARRPAAALRRLHRQSICHQPQAGDISDGAQRILPLRID